MAATFCRTLRFLDADRSRRAISGLLLAGLLTGWLSWLGLGRVTVYEVSATARLEVQTSAHPIAAPVGGRVAQTHLRIGTEVAAGDVLVVLDTETERRAIAEKDEGMRGEG